jgi:hypothetical protein
MNEAQLSSSRTLIVTNCTARKRVVGQALVLPEDAPASSVQDLAKAWVAIAQSAGELVEAQELYLGRSFQDARQSARIGKASLWIVSAGFGLLSATDRVPNYSLTVSEGAGSIRSLISACASDPAAWWLALNEELGSTRPLARLAAKRGVEQVLIAMPSSYLQLIAGDLLALPSRSAERLRILTSRAGLASLPIHLQARVLPYDARLERITGYAGTANDFPQRALRHFVEVVQGHLMEFDAARSAVESALGQPVMSKPPARAKLTDTEIRGLLRSQWQDKGGSSTKLLRYLRDDAMVACEQGRFRSIWQSMRAA